MSAPTSSATIEFPASALQDSEVQEILKREGLIFSHQPFDPAFTIEAQGDVEFDEENGVCSLHNPEARYGEFYDLEELLVQKAIPFDRNSSMDWNRPPETRVFRPVNPPFNVCIPDDESSGPLARLLKAAKAILPAFTHLPIPRGKEVDELEVAIQEAERMHPSYAPLTDWVKAEAAS
jgi:hypothetical protein